MGQYRKFKTALRQLSNRNLERTLKILIDQKLEISEMLLAAEVPDLESFVLLYNKYSIIKIYLIYNNWMIIESWKESAKLLEKEFKDTEFEYERMRNMPMREKINFALADQTYSETLQSYEEKYYESRILVCSA